MTNRYCEMIINKSYGGFQFSDFVCQLYFEKTQCNLKYEMQELFRYDPILIDLVKKYGDKVNTKYSKLCIIQFDKRFKNYIDIHEYDGFETATYNIDMYIRNTIAEIIDSEISSDNKIEKIEQLMNTLPSTDIIF